MTPREKAADIASAFAIHHHSLDGQGLEAAPMDGLRSDIEAAIVEVAARGEQRIAELESALGAMVHLHNGDGPLAVPEDHRVRVLRHARSILVKPTT